MTQGKAILPIPATHPAFAGHFPGMPIVPGVVLLDEVIAYLERQHGIRIVQVSQAKFLSPVRPGEAVQLHYEQAKEDSVKFHLQCADRQIASGMLRIQDKV